MAVTATKLKEERPTRTSRGWATTEQWEVADLDANLQYTNAAVIDPAAGLSTPGLPQYGNAHPSLPGALVTSVTPVEIVSAFVVIYLVTYRSWGLYTGGPRSVITSYGAAVSVDIPVFQQQVVAANVSWYINRGFSWQRQHIYRTHSVILGGNQVDDVQQAICRSVGGWYRIPINTGDFYLLSGRSSAIFNGRDATRVNYVFETWAKFPGAGAGDPVFKNSIAVPALGNLEDWQVSYPANNPTNAPVITVVPITGFASQGLVLPGFP